MTTAKPAKPAKPAALSTAAAAAAAPKRRVAPSRDKILAVATELFAERGYAGVSIRDIAGACGIGIPSIYHFYGDKDRLYATCCEQLFGEVEAALRHRFEAAATPHDRVRNVTVTLCEMLLTKRDFRRLLQMGLLQDDDRGIEKITVNNFVSAFRFMERGIAELGVRKEAGARALQIFALVFGQIELHRVAQMAGIDVTGGGKPETLAEHVLNVALPGLDWDF